MIIKPNTKQEIYSEDPFGGRFIDLYNIDSITKAKLNTWIEDRNNLVISGFWGERMSSEKKDGYKMALTQLKNELNVIKEWI